MPDAGQGRLRASVLGLSQQFTASGTEFDDYLARLKIGELQRKLRIRLLGGFGVFEGSDPVLVCTVNLRTGGATNHGLVN